MTVNFSVALSVQFWVDDIAEMSGKIRESFMVAWLNGTKRVEMLRWATDLLKLGHFGPPLAPDGHTFPGNPRSQRCCLQPAVLGCHHMISTGQVYMETNRSTNFQMWTRFSESFNWVIVFDELNWMVLHALIPAHLWSLVVEWTAMAQWHFLMISNCLYWMCVFVYAFLLFCIVFVLYIPYFLYLIVLFHFLIHSCRCTQEMWGEDEDHVEQHTPPAGIKPWTLYYVLRFFTCRYSFKCKPVHELELLRNWQTAGDQISKGHGLIAAITALRQIIFQAVATQIYNELLLAINTVISSCSFWPSMV